MPRRRGDAKKFLLIFTFLRLNGSAVLFSRELILQLPVKSPRLPNKYYRQLIAALLSFFRGILLNLKNFRAIGQVSAVGGLKLEIRNYKFGTWNLEPWNPGTLEK
jgi:hypothetical protein